MFFDEQRVIAERLEASGSPSGSVLTAEKTRIIDPIRKKGNDPKINLSDYLRNRLSDKAR
jgi:hypothetical protein